ncbi:MAG: hypothetical protein U0793_32630 [Gemmataceae bacterium]
MSRWDDEDYDNRGRRNDPWNWPHSGLGVASFIIVMCGFVICTLMIVLGAVIAANSRGWGPNPAEVFLIGGGMILGGILDLTALGLGIGGMCQPQRKKVFAILGTVFSALILIGALTLFLMALVLR